MNTDFSDIINLQKREIIAFLSGITEPKILVFDMEARKLFYKFFTTSEIKQYNIMHLYATTDYYSESHRILNVYYIYILLANHDSMKFMFKDKKFLTNKKNKHIICFLEKRNISLEYEYQYIWDHVEIKEFILFMHVIENDCIDMNITESLSKLFIDNNFKTQKHIAMCIEQIQRIYGIIPTIVSFGSISGEIKELIESDNKVNQYTATASSFDKLILIDRTVDLVTPCLTQLSYSGIIDEYFEIKNNSIVIDKQRIVLNADSYFYGDVRDKSINCVSELLRNYKANNEPAFRYCYKDIDAETTAVLAQMTNAYLEKKDSLEIHSTICSKLGTIIKDNYFCNTVDIEQLILVTEHNMQDNIVSDIMDKKYYKDIELQIIDYIDVGIREKRPIHIVLCCLSLYCQLFSKKTLNYSKIIEYISDSYNCYPLINYMQRLGMVGTKIREFAIDEHEQYNFVELDKKMNLVTTNEKAVSELSSLYQVYVPITVRLIEREKVGRTLVCFVGGCNYTEIGMCRLLGDIVVLSTNIYNRKQFIDSIRHM